MLIHTAVISPHQASVTTVVEKCVTPLCHSHSPAGYNTDATEVERMCRLNEFIDVKTGFNLFLCSLIKL